MTAPYEPNPVKRHAGNNADARKKYEQAAFRAGMPFILLPAALSALALATMAQRWTPRSLLLTFLFASLIVVVTAWSTIYGLSRIRKYKRDHPFIE